MKVSIKDLSVAMEIKNNGLELDIADGKNNRLGDLAITKVGMTWCKGKVQRKNGIQISWDDFIKYMESKGKSKDK